jgi:hypothetical protein
MTMRVISPEALRERQHYLFIQKPTVDEELPSDQEWVWREWVRCFKYLVVIGAERLNEDLR